MGIADFLKDKIQHGPNWLTLPLLHLNRLGPLAYGPAMSRFKKSIPSIDPEEKLITMANYAITHVPYYRNRYKGLKITSIEQFQNEIEFINRNIVSDNPDQFISDQASRIPHVTRSTSGTSGKPLHLLIPANRYVTEMAFVTRTWQRTGWNFGIRASIRKNYLSGRDYIVNPMTREIIFDGYRTDEEYLVKMQHTMKRNGVTTIYAYPSTAFQILKLFTRHGIDTSFITHALLTSEGIEPHQYRFISDQLGIKIASFYGHTEKLIFIEQIDPHTHAIEDAYGFTEIIGPDGRPVSPLEEGELVGTTFYNFVMPLLRYRTEDYATTSDRKITLDGKPKRILTSIAGRRNKSAIIRHDGTRTSSTVFEIHDEKPLHLDGIQYVQSTPGYMEVLVIPGPGYTRQEEQFMLDHYARAMGGPQYVTIRHVDTLITQPNGKTLPVINHLLNS